MKAMVLAAGLGTRLRPLTNDRPKALVEVNGRAMLDLLIERLVSAGFNEIIVNVHHFAEQVVHHLKNSSFPGAKIAISDESSQLLDTGGAIIHARWFLEGDEPFLVHNVDVLSDIDLGKMMEVHRDKPSLATLAVSQRTSSRYFLFDEGLRLWGWENVKEHSKIIVHQAPGELKEYAFSGIHILEPAIFHHISHHGRFSIVPAYLDLAEDHPIHGYLHDPDKWLDLGSPENIRQAEGL